MADDISKKITIEVEAQTEKLQQNMASLGQVIDQLIEKQHKLTDAGKQNSSAFTKNSAAISKYQNQLSAVSKQVSTFASSLKASGAGLQQNKSLLDQLTKANSQLSKSVSAGASKLKGLNKSTRELTTSTNTHQTAVKQSKTSFDAHKQTIQALNTEFNKIKGISGTFGPSLQEAAKGFNTMKTGLSIVKTGFKGVGTAIKETGFGFLLQLLEKAFDYFVNTSEGSKMLKGAISAIGVVVNTVKGFFDRFKSGIIDAVTHPVESLKVLGKMIVDNVINRFKAFSVILDGIVHLDFKKMADGVLQAATGVTHATDKIAKAVKDIGSSAKTLGKDMADAYVAGTKMGDDAAKKIGNLKKYQKDRSTVHKETIQQLKEESDFAKQSHEDVLQSQAKVAESAMTGLTLALAENEETYRQAKLKYSDFLAEYKKMTDEDKAKNLENYKAACAAKDQLDNEELSNKIQITKKFNEELAALNQEKLLEADKQNIEDKNNDPKAELEAQKKLITDKYEFEINAAQDNSTEILRITKERDDAIKKVEDESEKKKEAAERAEAKKKKDEIIKDTQQIAAQAFAIISKNIQAQSQAKISALEKDKSLELSNKSLTSAQKMAIDAKYKKQEGAIKAKAFKDEQKLSIMQAVINGAIAITKAESELGPIAGTIAVAGVIANTALQVATIASQKPPAYAKGGLHYSSDGKGGVLPGYSQYDNTNAYLRSGEGIVVSEAMQSPWARNLVSAINVGFGGRDFSTPVSTRGFAVGGIFTDGGNANRYYSQPANDQKNLANTIAYQMINNFPPVYVDVKDVNNQQNILAQTVNRVNL